MSEHILSSSSCLSIREVVQKSKSNKGGAPSPTLPGFWNVHPGWWYRQIPRHEEPYFGKPRVSLLVDSEMLSILVLKGGGGGPSWLPCPGLPGPLPQAENSSACRGFRPPFLSSLAVRAVLSLSSVCVVSPALQHC